MNIETVEIGLVLKRVKNKKTEKLIALTKHETFRFFNNTFDFYINLTEMIVADCLRSLCIRNISRTRILLRAISREAVFASDSYGTATGYTHRLTAHTFFGIPLWGRGRVLRG